MRRLWIILLFAAAGRGDAYWPITVEENLTIAATPGVQERYVSAHPGNDDKTIVIYEVENIGCCYQIIDKYGELLLPLHQLFCPGLTLWQNLGIPESIPDGEGGVIVCWAATSDDIFAQRIDSQGNRIWGDAGVNIYPNFETDLDLCTDGDGGMYVAVSSWESTVDWTDLWLQKVKGDGSLPWGEEGILVCGLSLTEARFPNIETDGAGGCIIVWEDNRPPYSGNGALYAQRYDSTGSSVWGQDILVCVDPWAQWTETVSDGAGGIIVQSNPGGSDYNKHWRIDGQGNILWVRDHLSWWYWGRMIPGELDFFYLCFNYNNGLYGQRVDINSVNYWPTWGSGQVGALLYQLQTGLSFWPEDAMNLVYNSPNMYAIHASHSGMHNLPCYYRINGLDSLGNRIWGDDGILMSVNTDLYIQDSNLVPGSEGGVISVFQERYGNAYDIAAKRVNSNGSLGGPNAPLDEVIITVSGLDLTLNWSSQAPGAEYFIRFSDNPYAFPALADTTISDTVFVDVNGVEEGVKFYEVRWAP